MNSALYEGTIRHRRFGPAEHGFSYTLFMAYLDLAELDVVFEGRWLWSATRPALARFRRRDHFGVEALPLDQAIRDLVVERTGRRPRGPIRLLTHLAYFGWCFNPLSLYYCFDEEDRFPEFVVAEVSNTPWLERHMYVLERPAGAVEGFRAFHRKEFHVSPFMAMNQDYAWSLPDPRESLTVHMENIEEGKRLFDATLTLKRREIDGASLGSALARWPFLTLKVVGAIHWQALKLWAKNIPVFTHPAKAATEAGR